MYSLRTQAVQREVTENGTEIYRNDSGQYHREDGPAVVYKSGFGLYYLHGKKVKKEDLEKRESSLSAVLSFEEPKTEFIRVTVDLYAYFKRSFDPDCDEATKLFGQFRVFVPENLVGRHEIVPWIINEYEHLVTEYMQEWWSDDNDIVQITPTEKFQWIELLHVYDPSYENGIELVSDDYVEHLRQKYATASLKLSFEEPYSPKRDDILHLRGDDSTKELLESIGIVGGNVQSHDMLVIDVFDTRYFYYGKSPYWASKGVLNVFDNVAGMYYDFPLQYWTDFFEQP